MVVKGGLIINPNISLHLDTFDILWLSLSLDLIDIIMRGCACIVILSYDYEMRTIEKRV